MNKCGSCIFFLQSEGSAREGLCRRFPPSPLVVKVKVSPENPHGERVLSHFPPMLAAGSCGEHVAPKVYQ